MKEELFDLEEAEQHVKRLSNKPFKDWTGADIWRIHETARQVIEELKAVRAVSEKPV